MEQTGKRRKLLFIISFGAMFMMGYIDSLRGPLIPKIRETFGVDEGFYIIRAFMVIVVAMAVVLKGTTEGSKINRMVEDASL